jgi:hypothetical protein
VRRYRTHWDAERKLRLSSCKITPPPRTYSSSFMIAGFVRGLDASRALSEFPVSGITVREYGLTQTWEPGENISDFA